MSVAEQSRATEPRVSGVSGRGYLLGGLGGIGGIGGVGGLGG